jgi:Ricin-type beta-trefoil lectin domain-like
VNGVDPEVLDVDGGCQAPNTGVIEWPWNGGYNQQWGFVPSPYNPGWYEIVNRGSGQCLSVHDNSHSPGTQLVQYPRFGGYDQLWYFGGNVQTWSWIQIQSASRGCSWTSTATPPWRAPSSTSGTGTAARTSRSG